jgi:hypothetical protein
MAETDLGVPPAADEPDYPEEPAPLRRSRLRLENAKTVRAHLVRIYDDVCTGRLTALEGNRRSRLLAEIAAVNRDVDLEKRLQRLEREAEARRPRR